MTPDGVPRATFSLLVVIVLYERALEEIASWTTISQLAAGAADAGDEGELSVNHVLIYDNSRVPLDGWRPLDRMEYRHDSRNGGTRAAYLLAIQRAKELGIPWILFLDHDTELPLSFLRSAYRQLHLDEGQCPDAVVPKVRDGLRPISPVVILDSGKIIPLENIKGSVDGRRIGAISSGTIFNVSTLEKLGTIPEALWLDYVDHWIFTRLHAHRARIVILDVKIEHKLSLSDLGALPQWRLENILEAERYWLRELPPIARFIYLFRIARFVVAVYRRNRRNGVAAFKLVVGRPFLFLRQKKLRRGPDRFDDREGSDHDA